MAEKNNHLKAPDRLKVLFTIINREKTNFFLDVLEGYHANFQLVLYGNGTLASETYRMLGLNNEKAIIISVVREDQVKEIMNKLEDKYFKAKNVMGIAFTVKLTSLIGVNLYQFLANKGEEMNLL